MEVWVGLTFSIGIENLTETSVATKERAFLDTLYTNVNFHFDNLRSVDWGKVYKILPIYENKRMAKIVDRLYKESRTG